MVCTWWSWKLKIVNQENKYQETSLSFPFSKSYALVALCKLPPDIHMRFCHARTCRYTEQKQLICIVENSTSWLWSSDFPPKLSTAIATQRDDKTLKRPQITRGAKLIENPKPKWKWSFIQQVVLGTTPSKWLILNILSYGPLLVCSTKTICAQLVHIIWKGTTTELQS